MNVFQIMSTPVITTSPETAISELRNIFAEQSVNAIPVVDSKGTIAGIISSSDVAKEHDADKMVSQLMTDKIHIVMKSNRVQDAAKVMLKHRVHHLVVMEEGHIVGMISSLDLLQALID